MTDDELTTAVVSAVAQYLQRRATAGISAENMNLEVLVNQVQSEATPDPLAAEMFHQLTKDPANQQAAQMLQMQLSQMVRKDPGIRKRLETAMRGGMQVLDSNRKRQIAMISSIAVVAVVALVLAFVIGRSSGGSTPAAQDQTLPQTVTAAPTTTETTETTSTEDTTINESTTTDDTAADGGTSNTGDGSVLGPGSSVMVTDLPKPGDQWVYDDGDHDVQLTQYPNSFWHELNTCSESHHADQQFTLKNFARLEVTAIGMDSISDPSLEVKFEVFAGADLTKAIATKVVKPGKTEKMSVALPEGTFALTFRASLTKASSSECLDGRAVWGRPYVVTGS